MTAAGPPLKGALGRRAGPWQLRACPERGTGHRRVREHDFQVEAFQV